jgi:two-component sensor histidine kinase
MMKASNGPGRNAGANFLMSDPGQLVRAVEAAGAGLWEWDLDNDVINVSSRLASLLGLPADVSQIDAARFFGCVHGDDIPLFKVALGEALRNAGPFVHEFRAAQDGDSGLRWLSYQGQVLEIGEDGSAVVLAGLCLDVTDRRLAQDAYDLLTRELSHRMKNLFSVVTSLVNMTSEGRPEASGFVSSFQARLNTLAVAHELLIRAEWQAIPLEALVEKALSPLSIWNRIDHSNNNRVMLGTHDAQTVILVLHELATNAIKYGALSNGTGRVELRFSARTPSDEGPALIMRWTEHGGPTVEVPAERGFGIRLIERLTKRQASGEAVLDWKPEGLCCCIELPLTSAT